MKALSKNKIKYLENKYWEEYKQQQEELESQMSEEELKIYKENRRKILNNCLETLNIVNSMIDHKY